MSADLIRQTLLATLILAYEADASAFVTLPKQTLDSSWARIVISELRNDGVVEEQVRGVIRLTTRGYQAQRHPGIMRLQELQLRTAV
jgi:hypothetical protein